MDIFLLLAGDPNVGLKELGPDMNPIDFMYILNNKDFCTFGL